MRCLRKIRILICICRARRLRLRSRLKLWQNWLRDMQRGKNKKMRLLKKDARLIGQGLTGTEGARALPRMTSYGTKIVAGVTPGKGGQTVEGVPVFNSIKEA